jgi:hypothetical protein
MKIIIFRKQTLQTIQAKIFDLKLKITELIQIFIYLISESNNFNPYEKVTLAIRKDENMVQLNPQINLYTEWAIMSPSLKFQSQLNITLTLFVQVS